MDHMDFQITELARDLLWTTMLLAGPVLIVGLVIGLCVSLFQALTSVQEQTMSLIPKMLGVMLVVLLCSCRRHCRSCASTRCASSASW
jgi:flagellar biosynthetic protein FliQ